MENITLPSNHEINETVNLNFFHSGIITNCVIRGVMFNEGKVHYDVLIPVDMSSSDERKSYTLVRSVDSAFIEKSL